MTDRSPSPNIATQARAGVSIDDDEYMNDILDRVLRRPKEPLSVAIPKDFHKQALYNSPHYDDSPVAKHKERTDEISAAYAGRINNRKLKLKDSFTRVLPGYRHEKKSAYENTISHSAYQKHERDLEGKPIHEVDRSFTHKFDKMKSIQEQQDKIRPFVRMISKSALSSFSPRR